MGSRNHLDHWKTFPEPTIRRIPTEAYFCKTVEDYIDSEIAERNNIIRQCMIAEIIDSVFLSKKMNQIPETIDTLL